MSNDNGARQGRIDFANSYTVWVNADQYTACRRGMSQKGSEWFDTIGYYNSLDKAIKACKQDYTRREIMRHQNTLNLDDAVSIIVRSNNHFESLIKNAFEGVTT